MTRRQRRTRIIALLGIFFVVALVATSGVVPLEQWLGWSGANAVLMTISAVALLGVVWDFLGFFVDKDASAKESDPTSK
jgi:membrane protease YdiL (CAAX protease family)